MVIAGLVVALLFSSNEPMLRIALNILFVMGIFYLIRGVAVVFFLLFFLVRVRNYGIFLRVFIILTRIFWVMICLSPLVIFHLFFGLLDTWIDFRKTVPALR